MYIFMITLGLITSFAIGLVIIWIIRKLTGARSEKFIDIVSLLASLVAIPFLLSDLDTLNDLNENFNTLRVRVESSISISEGQQELDPYFRMHLAELTKLLNACVKARLMPNDQELIDEGMIRREINPEFGYPQFSYKSQEVYGYIQYSSVIPATRENCSKVESRIDGLRVVRANIASHFSTSPMQNTDALSNLGIDRGTFSNYSNIYEIDMRDGAEIDADGNFWNTKTRVVLIPLDVEEMTFDKFVRKITQMRREAERLNEARNINDEISPPAAVWILLLLFSISLELAKVVFPENSGLRKG